MLLKTPARFQSIENVSAFITSVKVSWFSIHAMLHFITSCNFQ